MSKTLMAAQRQMPGSLLGFVAEEKKHDTLALLGPPSGSYQAAYQDVPQARNHPETFGQRTDPYDPYVHHYPNDFLLQVNLRNFSSAEAHPSAFAVPDGYKPSYSAEKTR